jgi:membrane protein DedA with SNARE-associated domain
MMLIIVVMVAAVSIGAVASFLFGFRVGGRFWQTELQHARFEAARAERQLHDLTREAFVAMADHADERDRRR